MAAQKDKAFSVVPPLDLPSAPLTVTLAVPHPNMRLGNIGHFLVVDREGSLLICFFFFRFYCDDDKRTGYTVFAFILYIFLTFPSSFSSHWVSCYVRCTLCLWKCEKIYISGLSFVICGRFPHLLDVCCTSETILLKWIIPISTGGWHFIN